MEVKPISAILTEGHDVKELLSTQFIKKLLAVIESGDYTFDNNYQPEVDNPENLPEKETDTDNSPNFGLDEWWSSLWRYMVQSGLLCDKSNMSQIPTPVQIVPDLTDDFTKRFYEKFENRISVKDFAAIAKDVYRDELVSYQRAIQMRHKKQAYLNDHWPTWYAKYMNNYNSVV